MPLSARSGSSGDVAIAEAVQTALRSSGNSWLKRIVVTVSSEVVILQGTVPTFYVKQLALSTVMRVPGVAMVQNDLAVGNDEV
jgi:osmotically-inducible protein OsmY